MIVVTGIICSLVASLVIISSCVLSARISEGEC